MNVFNTDNNKGMLWSLMEKQGKFSTVPSNINIGDLFESNVKNTEIKCKGNESLVNMNKSFLGAMMKDLSIYTAPSLLKKNKTELFNNTLMEKEKSFKDMMQVPAPATLDFSDGKGDGPIGNIDELLSKQLDKRNLDMPAYNNMDETVVKEWLTGESSNLPTSKNKEAHIKIGELVNHNISLDITPSKKTVKWSDDNSSENNTIPETDFPSDINNVDLRGSILKILKNQDYIINAIHDLQDRI